MSLRLDNYVKRKEMTKMNKLDLRKYRATKSKLDILKDRLVMDLDFFGVADKDNIIADLIKIPNFANLNFRLLIIVYLYSAEKNFDVANIVSNFDNDFKKIVQDIKNKNIFDLEKRNILFKFRQDFIIYLILINDIYENDEEEEDVDVEQLKDIEYLESSEDKNYDKYESLRDEYEYEQERNAVDEYYFS